MEEQARITRARVARAAAGLALLAPSAVALAAGFQLNENSTSGLGTAFASGAAASEDATTLWSNAAGISRLRSTQGAVAVHLVKPSIKFGDQGSAAALGQPLGGNGGDAGGVNVVPNGYVVFPINAQWSAGVGLNAPWGLVTEYDEGWVGRFQALKSSIQTINLNPAVSWKPMSNLAVGLGLNFQYIKAEFTNQVNYTAAILQAAGLAGIPVNPVDVAGLETRARVEGSDSAWGWNAGLLFDIDANSRVGLSYRSPIKYKIDGDATFQNPAAPLAPAPLVAAVNAQLANTAITSEVKLPAIVNLSYFRTLNSQWDVLADAQWTGWSSIKDLTFVRSNGSVLSSTPENFKDTWKFALGAHYRYDAKWTLRAGVALDKSPVQTEFRTPRLPDADRTWLTAGVQYKLNPQAVLDFGAGYIWVKDAAIDSNPSGAPAATAAFGRLRGSYDANVVLLSGQFTYTF
ncbi:MAG: outer membrane protein transport protein [Burkholderiaceae bacterium]|nr:outer membrane protein transport protein [Burkholderiaceae bacterium]